MLQLCWCNLFRISEYQLAAEILTKALDFLLKPKDSTMHFSSAASPFVSMELSYLKSRTGTFPKESKEYSQIGDDRTIAETYRMIGDAYAQMGDDEIDFALAMYACAFEINQHLAPIYQLDAAKTLRGMGDVCCKAKEKSNEATHYYQEALKVLKRMHTKISG